MGLVFPFKVEAKSYSINPVEITAQVQTDGSMKVEEKRTFNFDGSFTFAYQTINKLGNGSAGRASSYLIKDFSVCDQNGCYQELLGDEKTTADTLKPINSFYVDARTNDYYLKWFYRAVNENRVMRISYTVENAVTLHNDIADIYWKLIGSDWEIEQGGVVATFLLPKGIPNTEIQAWAHGLTGGKIAIPTNQEVDYSLVNLPLKTFFEARIIVPKSIFSGGAQGTMSKQSILDQENTFMKQSNASPINKNELILSGIILLGGAGWFVFQLVFFIKNVVIFRKYGADKPLPSVNLSGRIWEPSSDIDPAQVEQLISGTKKLGPNSFTATILSLVQNRFYKMVRSDQKEGFIFKDYKYYLVADQVEGKNPSTIQKAMLDLLGEIGSKKVNLGGQAIEATKLEDIVEYSRNHATKMRLFLKETLPKIVLEENVNEGYFDQTSHKMKESLRWWPSVLTIVLYFSGMFFVGDLFMNGIFTNLASLFVSLLNVGTAIILLALTYLMRNFGEKRTEKGALETAGWIAFKRHLEEYRQTVKDPIDSIIIWEKYLVYGAALGVSLKTLSELPIQFSNSDQVLVASYWGTSGLSGSGIMDFSSSLGSLQSAMHSLSSVSTSASGASGVGSSGGSFGGGSGGGGGGGGGGGAG